MGLGLDVQLGMVRLRTSRALFRFYQCRTYPALPRVFADHLVGCSHKAKTIPDSDDSLLQICAPTGTGVFHHCGLVRLVICAARINSPAPPKALTGTPGTKTGQGFTRDDYRDNYQQSTCWNRAQSFNHRHSAVCLSASL